MSIAVRTAIRLHPLAWRKRYADEVLGTLQDVADDHHGGRIPLTESVPLGIRGLWLRARSSISFWAGLVVVGLLIGCAATVDVEYLDGSLIDVLLRVNTGLGYSLPVLAAAAGWAGARARRAQIVGARERLRQLGAETWPLVAFTAVGYIIAVVVVVVRGGLMWMPVASLFIVLAQWAMILVAFAIGQLLGAVLPRVLVIFAAPAATWFFAGLLFTSQTAWNIAPQGFYRGIAFVFDVEPYTRVYLIAGIVIAASVLVVTVRPFWAKLLPVAVLAVVCILVSVQPAPPPFQVAAVERSRAELVCSSIEPVVCLWPEQEAAFGPSLRAQMAEAYAVAGTLGLPVDSPGPGSVARYAMTGLPHPDDNWENASELGLGTVGFGPDDLLPLYAYTMTSCCWQEPTVGDGEYSAVSYAASILLGVPPERALPAVVDPYTGQRNFEPSGVPDRKAAQTLVHDWLTDGVNGVRPPD